MAENESKKNQVTVSSAFFDLMREVLKIIGKLQVPDRMKFAVLAVQLQSLQIALIRSLEILSGNEASDGPLSAAIVILSGVTIIFLFWLGRGPGSPNAAV